MTDAFVCDAVRTPIGRYAGSLASVRCDDLGAIPIRALLQRNPQVDWQAVDDVVYGCANQAGEDNRNVARLASLLAGVPLSAGAVTVNRLCGSGLDSVAMAARAGALIAAEAALMSLQVDRVRVRERGGSVRGAPPPQRGRTTR